MTFEEYYAAVRRLGLVKSKVPTVYVHLPTREHYYVDDPTNMTPEQRAETIELLTARLGVDRPH
ncbi:MAG TPA: hypothetical protein VKT99_23140 [Xanthobacteraceae bacterium]|jgi:hypothetical protein|nr:hypothetical protein [Xanthobacteraceae bacterium]